MGCLVAVLFCPAFEVTKVHRSSAVVPTDTLNRVFMRVLRQNQFRHQDTKTPISTKNLLVNLCALVSSGKSLVLINSQSLRAFSRGTRKLLCHKKRAHRRRSHARICRGIRKSNKWFELS